MEAGEDEEEAVTVLRQSDVDPEDLRKLSLVDVGLERAIERPRRRRWEVEVKTADGSWRAVGIFSSESRAEREAQELAKKYRSAEFRVS